MSGSVGDAAAIIVAITATWTTVEDDRIRAKKEPVVSVVSSSAFRQSAEPQGWLEKVSPHDGEGVGLVGSDDGENGDHGRE